MIFPLARIIFGVLVVVFGLARMGNAGGKDTLAVAEEFSPGDTLRYTTDGSIPDRTSPYVLFGANNILVTKTTTLKARLYRIGFLPSEVKTHTVFVLPSVQSAPSALGR